jgi:multimeric flavodoxin WrbA
MFMKIIGVSGSPRKDGNTSTMLNEILEGAAEKGAETRMFHINELDMKGCQGCLWCRENLGECAFQDDFQEVLKEFRECDAVVLGTPIYTFNVTGQFKCFLDRCFCLVERIEEEDTYRSVLPAGKKIALVTSQGDENPESYAHIINYLQMLMGFLSGASLEIVMQAGTEEKDDAAKDSALLQKCREVGHSLAS